MTKIQIFAIGGTIDKVYFDDKSAYKVGTPMAAGILEESNVTIKYKVDTFLHKDSLDMNKEDRALVAKKIISDKNTLILVTHGTDTMIKTAKKVKKSLAENKITNKTVVFTGSMMPARFHRSDATFNVGCAIIATQCLPPGVYIVMNGKVFDPCLVEKDVENGCFKKIKKSNKESPPKKP